MSGGGSATSAAAAAHGHAANNGSQWPTSPLFPAFSQHLHAVAWAGGSGAGGAEVAAARRTALSSLWQWLQATWAQAEAGEGAVRRLILLYHSVTADQVALLCNVIRKAAVDGMEDEVSQRSADRSAAAEPEQRKRRLTAVRGGWAELIRFHRALLDADCVARLSPAPAFAALW
jgi:hypothetical protein